MGVNLTKGSKISLLKQAEADGRKIEFKKLAVGLGWDEISGANNLDLDAWAFIANEQVRQKMIYFGHKTFKGNIIVHAGDNLTGAGDGDDEVIKINLAEMPDEIDRIILGVTIYSANTRHQSFRNVSNGFIRVFDSKSNYEICKYSEELNTKYSQFTTLIFGELVRENGDWTFRAIGNGLTTNKISEVKNILLDEYLKDSRKAGNKIMAVSLSKGGKVSLAKVAADAGIASLKNITVGLGWDCNRYDGGADFDLDASAFCCGEAGKVTCDEDFVFYNNKVRPGVAHQGDNRTGEGDGDDEVIKVDLSAIPANITEVNFTVTIDQADVRHQNFGMVENSYIRLVDETTGTELVKYDLGEDFSVETAIVVAKLYRNNGEWKFAAIGSGFAGGLAALCGNFGVNV